MKDIFLFPIYGCIGRRKEERPQRRLMNVVKVWFDRGALWGKVRWRKMVCSDP